MLRRIDRSERLSKFLDRLSDTLARQRGLTIIIGIVLVIVSFLIQSVSVFLPSPSPALEFAGVVMLHVGVLTALIGLLLVNPLGR